MVEDPSSISKRRYSVFHLRKDVPKRQETLYSGHTTLDEEQMHRMLYYTSDMVSKVN